MRHLAASLKSGWPWWWGFGLLIALPALALAVLGLRAVRAERIEREQQAREQQTQIARLADAAISNALAALEAMLLRDETGEARRVDGVTAQEAFSFSFDQQGVLAFPRERVWFGEATRFRTAEWSPTTQQLIEQAQAAEAQTRQREAMTLYRRISITEPKLRGWAEVCVARIQQQSGEAAAQLSDAAWSQSADLTPTGLPVALMLCPYAERLPERSRFAPLLEQSLASLHSGRWWLSYDERHFYDAELRRLLGLINSNQHTAEDDRLRAMAALERIVRAALPGRRDAATHSYEAGFLLLWSPMNRAPDAWNGLALAQRHVAELIEAALTPLLAGQSFAVVLRETTGEVLWSRLAGNSPPMHTAALRSVSSWELVFSQPHQRSWPEQRELLWYGFILLLVVLLLIGLAMTARLVRREIELSRMQNEFIAAVSHEFKSPLTSIRLLMERITSGRLRTREATGEYYTAIVRETDRLERLVNRLLNAQQLQAGQRQYHFAPTSLAEILTDVVAQMRPQAEAKRITLELELTDDVPTLSLDNAVLADAVENLLDNALKYSPPGTRVTVTVQIAGDGVQLVVGDQGIGIEPYDLPHIFDRFYRGQHGDQHSVKGTGLGLALVKAAVEAHGGSVAVTSQAGQGSRFTLHLPIKETIEHGTDSGR